MEVRRIRRRYDHRFRDIVRETGDVEFAVRNGVPRSTARDWSRLASPKVITIDVASMSEDDLTREVVVAKNLIREMERVVGWVFHSNTVLRVRGEPCDSSRRQAPESRQRRRRLTVRPLRSSGE
jgi:hypothetical protein